MISQKRLFRLSWFFYTSFLSIKKRRHYYGLLILLEFGSELILAWGQVRDEKNTKLHFLVFRQYFSKESRFWKSKKKPFLYFIDRKFVSKNQPNRTNRSWDILFLIFCWRQQKFSKNDKKIIFTKNGKNFIIYIHYKEDILKRISLKAIIF